MEKQKYIIRGDRSGVFFGEVIRKLPAAYGR